MEDLYTVLKMMYKHVRVISRQSGIYYCLDNDMNTKNVLYVKNEIYTKEETVIAITSGKSWTALLYADGVLEIRNKKDASIMKIYTNVNSMSKQNLYNDRCSTFTVSNKNANDNSVTLLIIDNLNPNIVGIYEDVIDLRVDKRDQYELVFKSYDLGEIKTFGVNNKMEAILFHET